jgi:hypothetical protein
MAQPMTRVEFERLKQRICNEVNEELNMADETTATNVETSAGTRVVDPALGTPTAGPAETANAALEARVAELETLVHTIVTDAHAAGVSWAHGRAAVAWLEKMGAVLKSGLEKVF